MSKTVTYIATFVDTAGNPDFTVSPIYQINDVPEEDIGSVMETLTKLTDAVAILQPQRKTGVFSVESID